MCIVAFAPTSRHTTPAPPPTGGLESFHFHVSLGFHRVIDQPLYAFDESNCVRQHRMFLESCFISPLRVDVEELRVANRAKRIDTESSFFFTRGDHHGAQGLLYCWLIARGCMESRKDKDLHLAVPVP